jgi:hypothetical protein
MRYICNNIEAGSPTAVIRGNPRPPSCDSRIRPDETQLVRLICRRPFQSAALFRPLAVVAPSFVLLLPHLPSMSVTADNLNRRRTQVPATHGNLMPRTWRSEHRTLSSSRRNEYCNSQAVMGAKSDLGSAPRQVDAQS